MTPEALDARRAIEALRSGVPSRTVVQQLGTTHSAVEDEFVAALEHIKEGLGTDPIGCKAQFGQGKTHMLIHLRNLAEREGFATSLMVVSPETPLGNPVAILGEICRNASVEGHVGDALRELQPSSRTDTQEWPDFRLWARNVDVLQRFQALMFLYEELGYDVDFRVQILEDIQGKPLTLAEIRRRLKELGQTGAYELRGTSKAQVLAHERIRILARWFRAFGRHGLVVFFDELENLDRFSAKQRMAAYEQIAWWTDRAREDGSALLPVWFSSDEVQAHPNRDRDRKAIEYEVVGSRLRDTGVVTRQMLSEDPKWRGLELLVGLEGLNPPSYETLCALQSRVAEIYQRAYGIETVSVLRVQTQSDTVRQEIRRWIAYWDMQRLYPEYTPDIAVRPIEKDGEVVWDDEVVATGEDD